MNWLSLISTLVALIFAGFVLYRYVYRGGAHLLLWGIGLILYAIGTFAGVFPADGPVNARRYQILILMDEPQTYPRTGGFVAAPAVGRIADRIAPFLGVQRRADVWRTATGERLPTYEDVEGDGR